MSIEIDIKIDGVPSEWMTTAIHIRRDQWELLKDVAFKRQRAAGGRQSVSDILRTLIDIAGPTLREELNA